MQSLTLGQGTVQFCINGDPERTISFNPRDVRMYQRVMKFYKDAGAKQKEYERLAAAEVSNDAKDEYGLPVDAEKNIALMAETADWVCAQMDDVFGAGTARKVFGHTFTFEDFQAFFDFITSKFSQESQERVTKRLKKQSGKVMM